MSTEWRSLGPLALIPYQRLGPGGEGIYAKRRARKVLLVVQRTGVTLGFCQRGWLLVRKPTWTRP